MAQTLYQLSDRNQRYTWTNKLIMVIHGIKLGILDPVTVAQRYIRSEKLIPALNINSRIPKKLLRR